MHFVIGKRYLEHGFYEEAIEEWSQGLKLAQQLEDDQEALRSERKDLIKEVKAIQDKAEKLMKSGAYREAKKEAQKGLEQFKQMT